MLVARVIECILASRLRQSGKRIEPATIWTGIVAAARTRLVESVRPVKAEIVENETDK